MNTFLRKKIQFFSRKKSHSLKKEWLHFSTIISILLIIFAISSCASTENFSSADSQAKNGKFSEAYADIELNKKSLYPKTDQVLYSLDTGLLTRYAGNYELSNEKLSAAEKLIEEYFAISITQTINSYLLNDNVVDYAGEDYEDIYTNLFMALNYIQMDLIDEAFVEIRRFNNKLQLLSTKYAPALELAKKQVSDEGYNANTLLSQNNNSQTIEFYDSAFARYVSLLLYRSIGQMDSAEVDKRFIERAFLNQKQLYPFPIPTAVAEEFSIPNDKERLNVFCYTGIAPEKHENVLRLPGIVENSSFKLALPIMIKNSSKISSIQIQATDAEGNTQKGTLQLIESVENIAMDTFQQRQGLIYLKSLMRSLSKTVVNQSVTSVMQETEAAQWASVFNLAANLFTEFSEQADIRSSRYFPAHIWVGGLNVQKGLYSVEVTCYDAYNNIVFQQTSSNVSVESNNVNLVEAVCLL